MTELNKIGEKVRKNRRYKVLEDDFGFSIEEVEENIFLDPKQEEAVKYSGEKPLVINAGPGSGKTRVIIERVVYLVKELKKDPSTILVITFTRKATQELKERLIYETDLALNDINQIRISTVHGFCRHIISKYEPVPYNYLNRHGERSLFLKKYKKELGFYKYAFLYDYWIRGVLEKYDEYFNFKVDTEGLVKSLELQMEEFANSKNKKYKRFVDNFYKNLAKERHITDKNEKEKLYFTDYPNLSDERFKKYKSPNYWYRYHNVAKSYPIFREIMERTKTCDDNISLEKANQVLENKEILKKLPYTNILIDEFQDTDRYQMAIFEKLLTIRDTFTIVGDVDQSIFEWRGATPQNFEGFIMKYDVKLVTLETNYRSTRDIVEFNEALIKDRRTIPKNLNAKKKYKSSVLLLNSLTPEQEANRIVDLIINLKNDKKIRFYSDVAILFRKNSSIEKLIKPFKAAKIPYFLKDYKDYLDQDEVRAMLALFWYLMPYDKTKIYHLSEDFLNLYAFTNVKFKSSIIFGLTEETMNLLADIQAKYEKTVLKIVNESQNKTFDNYIEVFDLDEPIKDRVFKNIKSVDIGLLDKEGLINLGINNEDDLRFFLRLNELKSKLWNFDSNGKIESYNGKYDTLSIFYELLNLTDYFSEISLEDTSYSTKIKDNLGLFSDIIHDYEGIMGSNDLPGLFAYLNRVLKGYASPFNEDDDGFNKVHLLSMHSAKGLQYPIVIVGSIKQGLCPLNFKEKSFPYNTPNTYLDYKNNDVDISKTKHQLEEFRTIYVATTRAKDVLILSSIGEQNTLPEFFNQLQFKYNIKLDKFEPYNLSKIPQVGSSRVLKSNDEFPNIKFEEFLNDYLYCPFRYDIANNTRFKVKLKNDKYINMVLHKLLENIHSKVNINNRDEVFGQETLSVEDVEEKIYTIINYHNVSTSNDVYEMFKNVKNYWVDYGKDYKIIEDNKSILTQMKECDLHSRIDLIIEEEDGELSIANFIPSISNIPKDIFPQYKLYMSFYVFALKELDQYKDKTFKNIYLHSLDDNHREVISYEGDYIDGIIGAIDSNTEDIKNRRWRKELHHCENCEYNGNVCRIN